MTLSAYKFTDPFRLDPDDDEDFADDHVMGDWNPYESLGPDRDMDAYANRRTRPRQKTGAGKVLKAIDDHQTFFGGPMDDELGLVNLAQQNGTDPVLATRYNNADASKRADMAWNQAEADKWWDSATPERKAIQRDAAKAAKAYRTVLTGPRIGVDYTDPDTRNGFADISGLPRGNVDAVVNGSKAQRRAVLWANNAALQPWNPKWRVASASANEAIDTGLEEDLNGSAPNSDDTALAINAAASNLPATMGSGLDEDFGHLPPSPANKTASPVAANAIATPKPNAGMQTGPAGTSVQGRWPAHGIDEDLDRDAMAAVKPPPEPEKTESVAESHTPVGAKDEVNKQKSETRSDYVPIPEPISATSEEQDDGDRRLSDKAIDLIRDTKNFVKRAWKGDAEFPDAWELSQNIESPTADGDKEAFPIQNYIAVARGNPLAMAAILESHYPGVDVKFDNRGNPYFISNVGPVYLNKPGASMQDATELVIHSLVGIGAGRLGSRIGSSAARRALLAGLFNGVASLGLDEAARQQGSKQGYDLKRAGIEFLFGAGGEVLETTLRNVLLRFAKNPSLFDSINGVATEKGSELLSAAGIEPKKFNDELVNLMNRRSRRLSKSSSKATTGIGAGATTAMGSRIIRNLPRGASNSLSIGNAASGNSQGDDDK